MVFFPGHCVQSLFDDVVPKAFVQKWHTFHISEYTTIYSCSVVMRTFSLIETLNKKILKIVIKSSECYICSFAIFFKTT